MKTIFIHAMLMTLIGIASCSPFKKVTPNVNEQSLSPKCEGLTKLVKKNWKKHKELEYHEYNEDFLHKLQYEYRDCILTLTSEEVIQIFGDSPKDWGDSHVFFFLKKGCIGFPVDCEILVFAIKNNRVKSVYVKPHSAETEIKE